MQVAHGQGQVRDCALVQAAIGCCILLLLVPKLVLTLSNLRWQCFSCHQIAQRPHWHLLWTSPTTCAGGVFLAPTSAFTNVHTCLAMLPSFGPQAIMWTCPRQRSSTVTSLLPHGASLRVGTFSATTKC